MKQFKGTPGEWSVSDNNVFFDIVNDDFRNIADVCSSLHNFDNSVHFDDGVAAANARLIAAAPELLGALQMALPWLPSCDDELIHVVESAITKALGE